VIDALLLLQFPVYGGTFTVDASLSHHPNCRRVGFSSSAEPVLDGQPVPGGINQMTSAQRKVEARPFLLVDNTYILQLSLPCSSLEPISCTLTTD
jgi:hypothetical protein